MAKREDDRALAQDVLRGKKGAAEALFDRVFEWLYRQVCLRLNGDHDRAQDVVSESLLAGLRGLGNFRGDASLNSWFLRIALRKIADQERRRAPQPMPSGNGDLEAMLSFSNEEQASPLDALADAENHSRVSEALESLPARHKVILRWRYFEDSSVGEVALRLKVSPKAAERRLARARAALASELRQRHFEP